MQKTFDGPVSPRSLWRCRALSLAYRQIFPLQKTPARIAIDARPTLLSMANRRRARNANGRPLLLHRLCVYVAISVAVAFAAQAIAQTPPSPRWAVDARAPGPDAPPKGRSLFDVLASTDVPFPYEALIDRLERRAGCGAQKGCVKQVLIPLGRSLQRTAASPAFFKYPRIVAAVDREGSESGGSLLKDRIYLGYQEKNELIEIISYNETAGRFEFQVLSDYRPGAKPQLRYARRAICASCHQNLAPIFSRQLWQETNANPRVAALLAQEQLTYHGVPVRRGVDFPDAIDAATDRANMYGVWQRLWREGCGNDPSGAQRCRAALLVATLQYRLSGGRAFDENAPAWQTDVLPAFAKTWRERWPNGLAIPNPDIPNRDPLPAEDAKLAQGVALSHVNAIFEPLAPRAALEVWSGPEPETMRRFVAGLADFISVRDARSLDRQLQTAPAPSLQSNYEAQCELAWTAQWLRFQCAPPSDGATAATRFSGRVELRDKTGELNALALSVAQHVPQPLARFDIEAVDFDARGSFRFAPISQGLRARLADGRAVPRVELRWEQRDVRVAGATRQVQARAVVAVKDDFARVREALASVAVEDDEVFNATRIMHALFTRLGMKPNACCDEGAGLPSPLVEDPEPPAPTSVASRSFAAFYPQCASCHASSAQFPPNFLNGSDVQVAAAIKHCAPRLYTRLAMWRVPTEVREKTPMPPSTALPRAAVYHAPSGVAGLEHVTAELLRAEYGTVPTLDQLLASGYEALRQCLPPH
jgi:mono/diheme cytochrome c family protein